MDTIAQQQFRNYSATLQTEGAILLSKRKFQMQPITVNYFKIYAGYFFEVTSQKIIESISPESPVIGPFKQCAQLILHLGQ